jgi:hypothetical protein
VHLGVGLGGVVADDDDGADQEASQRGGMELAPAGNVPQERPGTRPGVGLLAHPWSLLVGDGA